jgi:hypothetical protein
MVGAKLGLEAVLRVAERACHDLPSSKASNKFDRQFM